MWLLDEVRSTAAAVAAGPRHVRIELDALGELEAGPDPGLDPDLHFLEGAPEEVASWVLTWDAINFGSGWFPTIRKRPGRSGSISVTLALSERFRADGPWSPAELRALDRVAVASALGQDAAHPLMELYAVALRALGHWLGHRTALEAVGAAGGSAERLAQMLAGGMPYFRDAGFYKRAQITANDLALAGVAAWADLDELTIFADNLVPHVLRVLGVLSYDAELARTIEAGEPVPAGSRQEREIRGSAVFACERLAERSGVPPRVLDGWLWNLGQQPRYKAVPRHRTQTVYY